MNKFSIITPCLNAEKYIEETINSVNHQTAILSGRAELEYIICDGQSTDKTLEIIQSCKCDSLKIISERDSGMYSALAKGLKLASGNIIAYINAGDYYHKCAFDIVLDIFEKKEVNWLTGYSFSYNEKSYAIPGLLPYKFRKKFFDCGIYGTLLPLIQQESTFWSSSLNNSIDYEYLSKLKLAGDFYLWLQFSRLNNLKIVEAYLGGFKHHKGQLSANLKAYLQEVSSIVIEKPNLGDIFLALFDKVMWYAPSKLKKIMNNDSLFRFNFQLEDWI
jgi:glycosyltransferase involved in cell wall biosynthesis